jgi:hypothetical protein
MQECDYPWIVSIRPQEYTQYPEGARGRAPGPLSFFGGSHVTEARRNSTSTSLGPGGHSRPGSRGA